MKQQSLGLGQSNKRTRRREFLSEMERVVPWSALVELVAPYVPEGRRGRPPFAVEAMLRIHFMQQWFNLSDPAMEDALHDVPLFREFAGLGGWDDRLPDESTILRFRHVLEKHKLAGQILQTVNDLLTAKGLLLRQGTVVDATLIAAPSSTKNASGERDPEMNWPTNCAAMSCCTPTRRRWRCSSRRTCATARPIVPTSGRTAPRVRIRERPEIPRQAPLISLWFAEAASDGAASRRCGC